MKSLHHKGFGQLILLPFDKMNYALKLKGAILQFSIKSFHFRGIFHRSMRQTVARKASFPGMAPEAVPATENPMASYSCLAG